MGWVQFAEHLIIIILVLSWITNEIAKDWASGLFKVIIRFKIFLKGKRIYFIT